MNRSVSSSLNQNPYARFGKRFECIVTLTQQVQACPWNRLTLNEVVTVEKCLQEVAADDPRLYQILNKLSNECTFVEPGRKKQHLIRNEGERLIDADLRKCTKLTRVEVDKMDDEIELFQARLEQLKRLDLRPKIGRLQENIGLLETSTEYLRYEFGLLLERVLHSFERTNEVLNVKVGEFLEKIRNSQLIRVFNSLPKLQRKCLIRLSKIDQKPDDIETVGSKLRPHFQASIRVKLEEYLRVIVQLYADLILITRIFLRDVPDEIECLKEFATHIEYLKKPLGTGESGDNEKPLLKRTTIIHHDLRPIELPKVQASEPDLVDLA